MQVESTQTGDIKPSEAQRKALEQLEPHRALYVQIQWCWKQGSLPDRLMKACVAELAASRGAVLSHTRCDQLFIGVQTMPWHTAAVWSLPNAQALSSLIEGNAFNNLAKQAIAIEALVSVQPSAFTLRAMKGTQFVLNHLPAPRGRKEIPLDMMAGGVNPTSSQFAAYQQDPQHTVIHMYNMLKFADEVEVPGTGQRMSGKRAYAQGYAAVAAKCIFRLGGNMVAMGRYKLTLIGAGGDPSPQMWDEMAVLQYPGRAAFLTLLSIPEYQEAALHRQAALQSTQLWATTPVN